MQRLNCSNKTELPSLCTFELYCICTSIRLLPNCRAGASTEYFNDLYTHVLFCESLYLERIMEVIPSCLYCCDIDKSMFCR